MASGWFSAGGGANAEPTTGVMWTSNKSLGVHSSTVHNAATVGSFTCAGSPDTDAADSSSPPLGQQPAQLDADPHLPLGGNHPQLSPDVHADGSLSVSSPSVAATARR